MAKDKKKTRAITPGEDDISRRMKEQGSTFPEAVESLARDADPADGERRVAPLDRRVEVVDVGDFVEQREEHRRKSITVTGDAAAGTTIHEATDETMGAPTPLPVDEPVKQPEPEIEAYGQKPKQQATPEAVVAIQTAPQVPVDQNVKCPVCKRYPAAGHRIGCPNG